MFVMKNLQWLQTEYNTLELHVELLTQKLVMGQILHGSEYLGVLNYRKHYIELSTYHVGITNAHVHITLINYMHMHTSFDKHTMTLNHKPRQPAKRVHIS